MAELTRTPPAVVRGTGPYPGRELPAFLSGSEGRPSFAAAAVNALGSGSGAGRTSGIGPSESCRHASRTASPAAGSTRPSARSLTKVARVDWAAAGQTTRGTSA